MILHAHTLHPATPEGFHPLDLDTDRGRVEARFTPGVGGSEHAVVCVGGVGGGWDTPAVDLYPWLCADLAASGVAGLRIKFRQPTVIEEMMFDVYAGVTYLEFRHIRRVCLVGHSRGGATMLLAAPHIGLATAVVALATQSPGPDAAEALGARALLLVHGEADSVLPPSCSTEVYAAAQEPKTLKLYPGAEHCLDEVADEVKPLVRDWIAAMLPR